MESSKFGTLSPGRNGEPPRAASCRSCNAEIWWVKTRRDKNMPVNPDDSPHFETCPNAKEHRGHGNSGGAAPPLPPPPAASGPVWVGTVELDDSDDPEWFVVRLKPAPGESPLKVGDLVKLMRRTK